MSGPHAEEVTPLPQRLVAYYRDMLAAHANGRVTGMCAVCTVGCCQDWRFAWTQLVCSGELRLYC